MADAPDVPGDQARTIEPLGRECPLPLLSPVEDRISQIRHRQDGVVGAAGHGIREVRLGHFGDDDVMVALFDDGGDAAFDGADGGIEDRGAVAAFMEGVAEESLPSSSFAGLKKAKALPLPSFPSMLRASSKSA